MILKSFQADFRRRFPELLGRPIVVALSGGADSVALLCMLWEASAELGCTVAAGHVHHHLRGADADADADHCEGLCGQLGVEIVVAHLEPECPRGASPEAWWRQERYRALEDLRRRLGCDAVATAHTRDDQAETVLLKLLRGAGPRGVAGVRRRSGTVVRPLLDVRHADLCAYLVARGTAWREDTTNADLKRPRARLRHQLLPKLATAFPGCYEHLAAFASALAKDEAILGELLQERAIWPRIGTPVPLATVAALPPALRDRWVLELAWRLPLAEPPSRRQLDAAAAMLDGCEPAAVDLGRRWVLRRRGCALVLSPPPVAPFPACPALLPSRMELPNGFVARLATVREGAQYCARLRAAAATLPLSWRPIAAGEQFGGHSAARLLATAGVPAEWRRAWPVLNASGTIIWLPAVGVAEGWTADGTDEVVAELEEPWERHDK